MGILESLGFPTSDKKFQEAQQNKEMNFTANQNQQNHLYNMTAQEAQIDAQLMESKSDLIRWQQSLDGELFELVMRLKGNMKIGGKYVHVEKPLCSDIFINQVVIPQCSPYISRNRINSNYTDDSTRDELKMNSNEIAAYMVASHKNNGIGHTKYTLVLRLIKSFIKPGAFRSVNGWTKKTDSTQFKRVETHNDQMLNRQDKGLNLGF